MARHSMWLSGLVLTAGGCETHGDGRPIGDPCESDGECESGHCFETYCYDPGDPCGLFCERSVALCRNETVAACVESCAAAATSEAVRCMVAARECASTTSCWASVVSH